MDSAMSDTVTEEDQEREFALASQINQAIGGQPVEVILNAMTRVMAAVLDMVRREGGEDSRMADAALFAGIVINLHALVHPDPSESIAGTLTVGSETKLAPEVVAAATTLCPPLNHLLLGLRLHYDNRHVANSWNSVLLNMLLEDGPEGEPGLPRAQRILQDILDGLPATYAQMTALRAMDDNATHEGGRA